ncbi:MAG: SbcC/MukB-like Walker B domain-containing protein, partial [Eubacteriaceae bacterium]
GLVSGLPFDSSKKASDEIDALKRNKKSMQDALEQARHSYDNSVAVLAELNGKKTSLEEQLKKLPAVDIESQTARRQKLTGRKQVIEDQRIKTAGRITSNSHILDEVAESSSELSLKEHKWTMIQSLSDTANGSLSGKEKIMLETWIQMTCFDRIIRRANTRLMVMSGGQYELKRRVESSNRQSQSGLELDVIDHYNGTERSVKTLSGGETFKASLALALGLSDEIQSSAGGIRLDTMFVDEGFGSLDEESLQQAIRALAGLSEANRLVGIISHVGELKEKIDRQIVVTKEQTSGSKAEIIL